MPVTVANTQQAASFIETLSTYLKDFNFLLVKDGDQLTLFNQSTGYSRPLNDGSFPIVFKSPNTPSEVPSFTSFPQYIPTSHLLHSGPPLSDPNMEISYGDEEAVVFAPEIEHDDGYSLTDGQTPVPEKLERFLPEPRQPISSDRLKPNLEGQFFRLETGLAENQQRERIAICPPSSYPNLVYSLTPPRTPHLVVTDVLSWRASELNLRQQVTVDAWPPGAESLEVHPKTPELLSNNVDKQADADGVETGFFFHFKIFTFSEESNSYELLDEFTSAAFRTVSHSKLCDAKRRPMKKKKAKLGKVVRLRQIRNESSSSSDRYEPYE
jgi:hypothetical protein